MQLTERLELVHRQLVTGEVQQRIDQHGPVAVGQHETIAVGPVGIGRVVLQEVVPQHLRDIGHAHGGAGVTGIGLLDGIHAERTNGVGKFSA